MPILCRQINTYWTHAFFALSNPLYRVLTSPHTFLMVFAASSSKSLLTSAVKWPCHTRLRVIYVIARTMSGIVCSGVLGRKANFELSGSLLSVPQQQQPPTMNSARVVRYFLCLHIERSQRSWLMSSPRMTQYL